MNRRNHHTGFSMVGMLISLACILVLFTILMTSMNKAITGEGSAQDNTVRSFEDKMYLVALHQSMIVAASDLQGWFIVPSTVDGSDDPDRNTTANLYSAMLAANYTSPKQLISANEYSGYVNEKIDYDFAAYNPETGIFWDQSFKADLGDESNVSFAHVPLYGERAEKQWRNHLSSAVPLIGNRGPKDGVDDPNSRTYGRNKQWGGHVLFADGHVDFTHSFTLTGQVPSSDTNADNLFKMDEGADGLDAILSFTRKFDANGPVLQFD